jgi:proteasome beta subunit
MKDDYTVTGSGLTVAYGTLESLYEDDLSMEAATTVAAEAVSAAAERDTGSGNGLVIAEVTDEGVDIDTYEYDDLL